MAKLCMGTPVCESTRGNGRAKVRRMAYIDNQGHIDNSKTDKAWGMHCLHQDQKVCALISSHHP